MLPIETNRDDVQPVTPTFATFYTTPEYREDAERLGRCCRLFGLSFTMIAGQELGSWKRNCNQKTVDGLRVLQRRGVLAAEWAESLVAQVMSERPAACPP